MKNSETGEYELVVGNGQLLSAFFIVVLLCGVAFGMGYMIGQNSQKSKPPEQAANTPANVVTQTPVQPAASSAAPAQPAVDTAASQPAASEPAAQPEPAAPQPTTQPARETPAAVAPPAPAPAKPASASEPPAGSYWQVGAYKAADVPQPTIHMLEDGGMQVYVKAFPDGYAHVLVGPYTDTRALSNARQELTTRFGIKTVLLRQLPLK